MGSSNVSPIFSGGGRNAVPGTPKGRINFILRSLEEVSQQKFEQEKIDHAGSVGDTYVGWMAGHAAGWLGLWDKAESWNDHFQKTRPNEHKKARDEAIESLTASLQKNPSLSVVDTLSWMAVNGYADKVKILKDPAYGCDIGRWISVASIQEPKSRYEALAHLADEYRLGARKDFFDFQLPSPRLGKGGFWNRTMDPKAWAWRSSPELTSALSICNAVGAIVPSPQELDKLADFILLAQLSEEDQQAFLKFFEKGTRGEKVDSHGVGAILERSPLTEEGKKRLRELGQTAEQMFENNRLLEKVIRSPSAAQLHEEQIKDITVLVQKSLAGELSVEEEEKTLEILSLSSDDRETLRSYLRNLRRLIYSGAGSVDAVFHEAGLTNPKDEQQARWIFEQDRPTDSEKDEFKKILSQSKLSEENRIRLETILDFKGLARRAQETFYDILGHPLRYSSDDPEHSSDQFSPRSTGSLHNEIQNMGTRSVGLGIFSLPTVMGSGIGYLLGRRIGLRSGYGALVAPILGALLLNGTKWGQETRSVGWDVVHLPSRPWSDLAMMDFPQEVMGLYRSLAAGSTGVQSLLEVRRMIGPALTIEAMVGTSTLAGRMNRALLPFSKAFTFFFITSNADDELRPPTPLIPPFSQKVPEDPFENP